MQPGDVIPFAFHASVLALSFLVSVLGALVALTACARIRTANADGRPNLGYVALGALALGGVGIWSMHFIGMLAQQFPWVPRYDIGWTLLSLAVAVVFSGAALWFVGSRSFSLGRCLLAGVICGLGVAAMHYLGVAALRGPVLFVWRPGLVLLSVLIAIAAASAALWLAFNVTNERQRIWAALAMAVAVCGMHYTGIYAGIGVCTAPVTVTGATLGGTALPYLVFGIALVTLGVMQWQLWRSARQLRASMSDRMDVLLQRQPAMPLKGGRR